jgi:hypothetical protein
MVRAARLWKYARTRNNLFSLNDAKTFKQKIEQSLKERQGKGFSPKNLIFNPGGRDIDHVLIGFQDEQKERWHIKLDNGLRRFAEIYFGEKDTKTFSDKVNECKLLKMNVYYEPAPHVLTNCGRRFATLL